MAWIITSLLDFCLLLDYELIELFSSLIKAQLVLLVRPLDCSMNNAVDIRIDTLLSAIQRASLRAMTS